MNNAGYVVGVDHVGAINDKDIEGMFATNVFGLISITQLLVKGFAVPDFAHPLQLTRYLFGRVQKQEIGTRYQSWFDCWPRSICGW